MIVDAAEIDRRTIRKSDWVACNAAFIDCRTPDEHEESRIPGAKLVPMQDLDLHLDELQQHKDKPFVIHCRSGKRSMTVTTVLRQHGFLDVKSMAGGIQRWAAEVDPNV